MRSSNGCGPRGRHRLSSSVPDDRRGQPNRQTITGHGLGPAILSPPVASFTEPLPCRVGDVLGTVVNIENLVATAELPRRSVPDPLGTVAEDGDRAQIGNPEPDGPYAPTGSEIIDRLDRRKRDPRRRGRQVRLSQFSGVDGSPRSRRAKMPIFMSRQPSVVLTLAASVWNSTSPGASVKVLATAGDSARKPEIRGNSA